MPEEINRIVTDRISDLLLAPDEFSVKNLIKEGVSEHKINFTGNIMIDSLKENIPDARKLKVTEIISGNIDNKNISKKILTDEPFALLTLHRPANVDNKEILQNLVNFLIDVAAKELLIVWPVHPRAGKNLKSFGLWDYLLKHDRILLLHPVSYIETLKLNDSARIVLTDSGGLQEEATVLGTPCLTLRDTTERPVTLRINGGTSVLTGNDIDTITKEFHNALRMPRKPYWPPLWDGRSAGRCVEVLVRYER